ncbi:hypothetical protein EDB92DRAFT_1825239 [Lactarius akahatsu]|uniref:Uncharacterized protein n=1 Tax=Lactarius akahatsu TaxID=416441 RepID=A0AAD4LRQ1_9AGAM|nr:hypothetical protein EDB92DRAFT_1825239 [Lactarius akahatsu]
MPLICQPSLWGLESGTCHTRSQRRKHAHTTDKSPSTKSSQRNNAAYVHTVNVVLPEKPHPTHLVASGKGEDRSQNVETNPKSNAEISAVPDPVPNPLIPAVLSFTAEQTGRPFQMPKTVTGDASSSVFSTRLVVPNSLLSRPFTASALSGTSSLTSTLPTSKSAEHPVSTLNKAPSRQTTPHQLSTTIITLLTLGGAFLVIAILIGVKVWIQPRRRPHPTPSLPILQDAFPPARKMGDESPLFGGKERLSSQTGNGGVPWTWTQYQSGIPKPVPAANVPRSGETDQTPMRYSCQVEEAAPVTHTGAPGIPGTAKPSTNYGSDGHPGKAPSRLSTLSGLVYPGSTYESPGQENIGIAVGYGQGPEYGGTESTVSKRASTRNMEKRRRSTIYGSPEGLAYTMSPRMAPVVDDRDEDQGDGFLQGRARVKAPYGAGSYFRGSASTTVESGSDEMIGTPQQPNQKWVTPKNVKVNEAVIGHPGINMSAGLSGDKPPRVPSPPILPSLAQMAEYRSPTYSFYGLYCG